MAKDRKRWGSKLETLGCPRTVNVRDDGKTVYGKDEFLVLCIGWLIQSNRLRPIDDVCFANSGDVAQDVPDWCYAADDR